MNDKLVALSARCVPDVVEDRIIYEIRPEDLVLYSECNDMMVHSFEVIMDGTVILYVDDGESIEFQSHNDPKLDGLSLWTRLPL